jgi:hypothetical protein
MDRAGSRNSRMQRPTTRLTPAPSQDLTALRDAEPWCSQIFLTPATIAEQLGLSRKTLDVHRTNLMRKLALHDVTELVKYALRTGLITLDA